MRLHPSRTLDLSSSVVRDGSRTRFSLPRLLLWEPLNSSNDVGTERGRISGICCRFWWKAGGVGLGRRRRRDAEVVFVAVDAASSLPSLLVFDFFLQLDWLGLTFIYPCSVKTSRDEDLPISSFSRRESESPA